MLDSRLNTWEASLCLKNQIWVMIIIHIMIYVIKAKASTSYYFVVQGLIPAFRKSLLAVEIELEGIRLPPIDDSFVRCKLSSSLCDCLHVCMSACLSVEPTDFLEKKIRSHCSTEFNLRVIEMSLPLT